MNMRNERNAPVEELYDKGNATDFDDFSERPHPSYHFAATVRLCTDVRSYIATIIYIIYYTIITHYYYHI